MEVKRIRQIFNSVFEVKSRQYFAKYKLNKNNKDKIYPNK